MTARKATAKLYVAVVTLVTLVFSLLCALVKLTLECVMWAGECVRKARSGAKRGSAPARVVASAVEMATRHASALSSVPPSGEKIGQAMFALQNMGFPRPAVNAWAKKVGDTGRVADDVGELVKDGLRSFSAS